MCQTRGSGPIETDSAASYGRVQQFWDEFVASSLVAEAPFNVLKFGDGANLADELAAQVVDGQKRALTLLLRDFTETGKTVPTAGAFAVIVDGKNLPRCIVRVLQVEVMPLRHVDERYAWYEGGGDRSIEWWRSAHRRYFKRQGAREGFSVDDAIEVVMERFEVVWPLEFSDGR